jgi:hypothetical protein
MLTEICSLPNNAEELNAVGMISYLDILIRELNTEVTPVV